MKIGANNLGVAVNTIKKTDFTLRQASAAEMQQSKNTAATSWDRNNMKFHSAIGGADFDYTKEDAIQSAWNKQNGFNLFDRLSGKDSSSPILGDSMPTADFIDRLEKEGLTTSVDWFSKETDFGNLSADQLKESMNFLSSQYAVMKKHISQNFTGNEQKAELEKLNQMVDAHKTNIANAFTDKVGGFFEDNGIAGEREKIYQSIVTEFDNSVAQYENFIKDNGDYARISGTKDEWLKNDTNYMASELRKSVAVSTKDKAVAPTEQRSYDMEELQAVGDMVDEIKSYGFAANNRNKTKTGSEEEIGLNLAELALKTQVFSKNSNVSASLKKALSKSVDNFIKDTINEIDAEYRKKSDEAVISADKKGYAPLDKNAITSVIDKVLTTYEKTGSASKSMKDGAVFAVEKFNSKRNDNGEVYRYKGNAFRDFYKNDASKLSSATLSVSGYHEEKSQLESLIGSFNSFVDKFSLGMGSYINTSEFSALA